ncbi:MAG: type II toxin-antitoxin system HigB family toxin [Candidatus Melainabacteria bacterium]|nr:MAG: type II toxin-antitoxin system HigB family toxin [Candidatus Melainabacteria bacterium]
MKLTHWGRARQFYRRFPQSRPALVHWKDMVFDSQWSNLADVKNTFNSADWYQGSVIFDIGGNKFRLIAICRFEVGRVYIDKILTHEEYEKGDWKKSLKTTKRRNKAE